MALRSSGIEMEVRVSKSDWQKRNPKGLELDIDTDESMRPISSTSAKAMRH
jgi:hypothetical protein